MSWLTKFIGSGFYTMVEPELYYEWQHSGFIPANTRFRHGNTRNIKTIDKIALSVDSGDISEKNGKYFSTKSIPFSFSRFISGTAKDKNEILREYKEAQNRLKRELELFKHAMIGRGYFIRNGTLYAVKNSNSNAVLENYGRWNDILEKAGQVQKALETSKPPGFKSLDLRDLRNLANALVSSSGKVPFDNAKMLTLLKLSRQAPRHRHEKDWTELFCEIDGTASRLKKKINRLGELAWIKLSSP